MKDFEPHFCKGKHTNIALVFSAPGRVEEENGKPVSGMTGKNLRAVLTLLRDKNELFKKYNDLYEFRITNAVSTVEYNSKTGRSEAGTTEIKDVKNIQRLEQELKDIKDYIIFFGNKAQLAIKEIDLNNLQQDVKIITSRHLSPLSLNRIRGMKTPEERINFIVNNIIEQTK